MSDDRELVDRIDELVDEQLAGYHERSGYDYNVNEPNCAHCGDDWHGLPITRRVRTMREEYCCEECSGRELAEYRSADDDTETWCPGSTFIGPWATPDELARIRNGTAAERVSLRSWPRMPSAGRGPYVYREYFTNDDVSEYGPPPTTTREMYNGYPWVRYRDDVDRHEIRAWGRTEAGALYAIPPNPLGPDWTLTIGDGAASGGRTIPAAIYSWALHADTGNRSESDPMLEDLVGALVVLAGTLNRGNTARGDTYLAGYVEVRDVPPYAYELLAQGKSVFVSASTGPDNVEYMRVDTIAAIDAGGPAWRIEFDQRRDGFEISDSGYMRVVQLVEPAPPQPFDASHPHYRYTVAEQTRLRDERLAGRVEANLGTVRVYTHDPAGNRRELGITAASSSVDEHGRTVHTFTIPADQWDTDTYPELGSLPAVVAWENPLLPAISEDDVDAVLAPLYDYGTPPCAEAPDLTELRAAWERISNQVGDTFDGLRERISELRGIFRTLTEPEAEAEPEPDLTPQQRALPRPSHEPPMWANNPTRTRRTRNRGGRQR